VSRKRWILRHCHTVREKCSWPLRQGSGVVEHRPHALADGSRCERRICAISGEFRADLTRTGIQSVPDRHGIQAYPSFVQPWCGWAFRRDPWVLSDRSRWTVGWPAPIPGPRSDTDLGCRGINSQSRSRLGHLEKFKVPVRRRDAPPFSTAQALENQAERKTQFSASVLIFARMANNEHLLRSPLRMRRYRPRSITFSRTWITESWVATKKTDSAGCSTES
jgi:hypothetical protein